MRIHMCTNGNPETTEPLHIMNPNLTPGSQQFLKMLAKLTEMMAVQ